LSLEEFLESVLSHSQVLPSLFNPVCIILVSSHLTFRNLCIWQ